MAVRGPPLGKMNTLMKPEMRRAREELVELLEANELTSGMYVRVHGDNLLVGRNEHYEPDHKPIADDRVRLTRLSRSRYGLSVKRHTGRWEQTPFSGTMKEMVDAICTFMQHLVAP